MLLGWCIARALSVANASARALCPLHGPRVVRFSRRMGNVLLSLVPRWAGDACISYIARCPSAFSCPHVECGVCAACPSCPACPACPAPEPSAGSGVELFASLLVFVSFLVVVACAGGALGGYALGRRSRHDGDSHAGDRMGEVRRGRSSPVLANVVLSSTPVRG